MELNSAESINMAEVEYIKIKHVTSIDIRAHIYFKHGNSMLARVSKEKAEELLSTLGK